MTQGPGKRGWGLWLLVFAWAVSRSSTPCSGGQPSQSAPLVASLSAAPIQSELLLRRVPERVVPTAARMADAVNWRAITAGRAPTDEEIRQKFEEEYQPLYQSRSAVKHQLETAKYHLDEAVFTLSQWSKNLDDVTEFKLGSTGLRRASSSASAHHPRRSVAHPLENASVKFDVQVFPKSPYIGVRFIIPIGN